VQRKYVYLFYPHGIRDTQLLHKMFMTWVSFPEAKWRPGFRHRWLCEGHRGGAGSLASVEISSVWSCGGLWSSSSAKVGLTLEQGTQLIALLCLSTFVSCPWAVAGSPNIPALCLQVRQLLSLRQCFSAWRFSVPPAAAGDGVPAGQGDLGMAPALTTLSLQFPTGTLQCEYSVRF
jgi:hypothetical protein